MYYRSTKMYGGKSMKPRVFVSSTFYDLKYIREDLANFIRVHDFEPILFEDGDIGYTPGQSLDKSCYDTMKSADMVILIIGGNYGSPASGEKQDEFDEYMSVTRNEFREAVKLGIPIYAFVDRKVYSEYEVYELNAENIEEKNEEKRQTIKFKSTKNINVFRFIKEIKTMSSIFVTEFDKTVDIKEFLSKQWSDMFKTYLNILKEKQSDERVEKAVEQMQSLIKKMDIMLDAVGRKTLSDKNSNEYNMVIDRQRVFSLCNGLIKNIRVQTEYWKKEQKKEQIQNFLETLYDISKSGLWEKWIHCDDIEEEGLIVEDLWNIFEERHMDLISIHRNVGIEIEKNKEIFENNNLKQILIDELCKEENYNLLFK